MVFYCKVKFEMKIKFLGAAGTVTGSCYVLTSGDGQSILIDCGMFQGPPDVEKLNYEPFACDANSLTGLVLTHAHLDHCGRLPTLLPNGFNGKIWMTPGTRDLTELSLLDAAKVANGKHSEKVLFNRDQATKAIMRFELVDYRKPVDIGNFTVTYRDAGHILGSASLDIVDKSPNSQIKKIVFSGDLGNSPEPLVQKTEMIEGADAVVMESTYGDRLHPEGSPIDIIASEIKKIESGGTLLIPAFSLERTQEILHIIMHLKKEGKIQAQTPVYLDSPMAQRATSIYMNYKENFNPHIQEDLAKGDNPFAFPGFFNVEAGRESEALHVDPSPKVIVAGGGMMTGGRIVGHARFYLPIASTRLLIVGYQGEGTLGRELLEGSKKPARLWRVMIDRVGIEVRGTVSNTQTMSSHADQSQLMSWLKNIKGVKKVFLTHGEDEPRKTLAKKINEDMGIADISLPVLNQEIEF